MNLFHRHSPLLVLKILFLQPSGHTVTAPFAKSSGNAVVTIPILAVRQVAQKFSQFIVTQGAQPFSVRHSIHPPVSVHSLWIVSG
jgi:hypothetical protein